VFVDWVADLFARSDLIHRQCCLPKGGVPSDCRQAAAAAPATKPATKPAKPTREPAQTAA
jgi:hypothetical protein